MSLRLSRLQVKCDKGSPNCSTCRKAKLDCIYQAPPPRKRRRRPDEDIHEKLERYERLLESHGILSQERRSALPEEPLAAVEIQLATPTIGERDIPVQTGRLLAGRNKTHYVDTSIWKTLSEDELEPSSDEGEADHELSLHANHSMRNLDPVSSAILNGLLPSTDLSQSHPSYEMGMKLWEVYVERVNPLLKIVHKPTGLVMIQHATTNPSSIARSTEPLIFAIYHLAVKALTDEECIEQFGQFKEPLQAMYCDALRQAFVNASFLRSTDFQIAQAFVLFLISVRTTYDPQAVWILSGVAVRICQRIGLHRDGEDLGLEPFEVQMRRRLFWQVSRSTREEPGLKAEHRIGN